MATYKPNVPGGQLITFDEKRCGDDCLIIGNAPYCGDNPVVNHNFIGDWTSDWTIVRGTAQGTDPAIIKVVAGPIDFRLSQAITLPDGDYKVFYSFANTTSLGTMAGKVEFDAASTTLFTASSNLTESGVVDVSVNWGGSGTLYIEVDCTNSNEIIRLDYLYICPADGWTPEQDFCFQVPLFSTGTNLIGSSEVSYTREFENTTDYNLTKSITGAVCSAPQVDQSNINSTPPTAANAITQVSKYFYIIGLGDITIDWALNDDYDTSKELLFDIYGQNEFPLPVYPTLGNSDTVSFTAGDANSSITLYGTNEWDNSVDDPLEVYIRGKEECDGTNERLVYDVNVTNLEAYPLTYETTATLANDTFYKLSYTLNKCSISSVKIVDSGSTTIFEASSDGVKFDKIFKTGTLPSATVTFRFTVGDFLDYPAADFSTDVLTDVSLLTMCDWDMSLEDVAGTTVISSITETHDTTAETTGTSYHPNIEYCFDTGILAGTCKRNKYKVRATKVCDTDKQYLSNCLQVCEADCELSQVAWTPGVVICSGSDVIDYSVYASTQFFWAKVDVQDMTIERDREIYRRADGFWEMPYTYQHTTEILQIWPVPPHVRKALSVGMTGTFTVDGIEYEVINDDDIAPLFNATYEAPIRIAVHRVGEFTMKR